ncbi:MAG: hypothetical protein EOM68_07210 [Spirochaetia bacterium]|nr:hypothetical protein [Spirochaetia bacterium]
MTLAEKIAEQLGVSSTSVMVVNNGEEIYINCKLWNLDDWHEPAYPLRIRASVEILNPTHPQAVQIHMFYSYMKAQGLPEHTDNGIKYVYVTEIDPAHQDFFDMLQEVESEKRPEPNDFE